MRLSAKGLQTLKELEGFSSKAYRDSTGYSIGYGHFILPNETRLRSVEINESVASVYLKNDVLKAENYVNAKKLTLNQNQFDALVIFVYNMGSWGDGFDTLIKAKKYSLLPSKWREYKYSKNAKGEKVINGNLMERREVEIKLFFDTAQTLNRFLPLLVLLVFFFIK